MRYFWVKLGFNSENGTWSYPSGLNPTFHYWLYPVWLCMWQINKNLEPWTESWNVA